MKFIAIEEKTFEVIKERFGKFIEELDNLNGFQYSANGKWLDSQYVCRALQISKRTLQYYKASGKIPFSMIGNKIYFRIEDVHKLLENPKQK